MQEERIVAAKLMLAAKEGTVKDVQRLVLEGAKIKEVGRVPGRGWRPWLGGVGELAKVFQEGVSLLSGAAGLPLSLRGAEVWVGSESKVCIWE